MFRALIFSFLVASTAARTFPTLHAKRNISAGALPRSVDLRVLPLGDSITNGFGSSDGNGYRDLFVDLTQQGGPVDMIGSEVGFGVLPDEHEEGWNGYTIDQISGKATNALAAKPNLVLLLAGTNNMNNESQASTAPADMSKLVDKIMTGSSRTVLLVGTIPPSTWPGRQPLNDAYNANLSQIVSTRQSKGEHILLVPAGTSVPVWALFDGLHPNDIGYANMSIAWANGVDDAQRRGWFQEAEAGNGYVAPSNDSTPGGSSNSSSTSSSSSSSSSSAAAFTGGAWWHLPLMLTALSFATAPWLGLSG